MKKLPSFSTSSLLILLLLSACAPLPQREPRAGHSSLGCMRAALDGRLPRDLPDAQIHCIAAGLIARHCSVTEAHLASVGKELQDVFGSGDAEWRDLEADGRGIRCARTLSDDQGLRDCCLQTPAQPKR